MRCFAADLHVHTALSPCAEDEMTPPAVVRAALDERLTMIAICDHNTASNVAAVQEAAGTALTVLPGIEITTSEEIHVVGLFADAKTAQEVGDAVREGLPGTNGANPFGSQPLMNAAGETVAVEPKVLSAASGLTLAAAIALVHEHGGLAIAAHVDRPSFSVTSQLGAVPQDAGFDAIEVSAAGVRASRQQLFARLGLPVVASSDSHFLSEVGTCRSLFEMEAPTFREVALTFRGVGGRSCQVA